MTESQRSAIQGILAYFESNNGVPVDRAVIRANSTEVKALRDALAEPVQEPAGEVISASCEFATVRWFRQTSPAGGGDPKNSWSWPITGDRVYVAAQNSPADVPLLDDKNILGMWHVA